MLADTDYLVDVDNSVGRIVRPYGVNWPSFTPYPVKAIKIRYDAGYTAETLPKPIKTAMLLHIGYFYKNRDAAEPDAATDRAIKSFLQLYKVGWF
jgi:hypothetical protein